MAKIFSQLEKAQLENTTSDTASHPKGMITYRTDINQAKVSNGTTYKLLIDEDSTQTLSNKTYASPATTGAVTSAQTTTPANPSAGSNKLYFKADGKLYTLDSAGNEALVGSGAGGGVKNLITNGNADDTSSSIFVPYADAAATRPVDGTGGSPTVTTSVTSSSPLDGTKSFLLTKTAVNSQGQGWAIPFTVDTAYKAKALKISADFIVNSGTFVAGSNGTSPTDGDVIWTIYDVTNSQIIEPSNIKMFSNSSSLSDKFEATFQSSATGSSYRLIAHVASTSALAFELKVDNVTVSPQTYVYGTPVTDWVSYTPTLGLTTNTTNISGRWRRLGDSIEVQARFELSGTPAAGSSSVSIPSGLTIDTSKLPAGTQGVNEGNSGMFGSGIWEDSGIGYKSLNVAYASGNTVMIHDTDSGSASVLDAAKLASGDAVGVSFQVPIVGWSSSTQMSDGYDARVIVGGLQSSGSTSVGGTTTKILLTTALDSSGGITDQTNSRFLINSAGYYVFTASTSHSQVGTLNSRLILSVYKNGSEVWSSHSSNGSIASNTVVFTTTTPPIAAKGGDYFEMYFKNDSGSNVSVTGSFYAQKLQGPQTIAASEKVSILYQTDSGQSLTSAGSTIIYEDKLKDSHNAYNTSTGVFTAPRSGDLKIAYSVASLTVADSEFSSAVQRNGSTVARFASVKNPSLSRVYPSHTTSIPVVSGDQVKIVNVDAHSGASVYASSADNTLAMWMD